MPLAVTIWWSLASFTAALSISLIQKPTPWFKEVIKKNMIELGCGGWMADFGEYLPTDTYLHNGVSAEIMHNALACAVGEV